MRGTNPVLTVPVTLSATIAANSPVTAAGAAATAAAFIFGVALVGGVSGDVVPVCVEGTVLMNAGGNIAAGAFVQVHTTVTQVVTNATSGKAIGVAMHGAASGELVLVRLTPQAVASA